MLRHRFIKHEFDWRGDVDFLVVEYVENGIVYYWVKFANVIDVTVRYNYGKRYVGIGAVKYEDTIEEVLFKYKYPTDVEGMLEEMLPPKLSVIKGGK